MGFVVDTSVLAFDTEVLGFPVWLGRAISIAFASPCAAPGWATAISPLRTRGRMAFPAIAREWLKFVAANSFGAVRQLRHFGRAGAFRCPRRSTTNMSPWSAACWSAWCSTSPCPSGWCSGDRGVPVHGHRFDDGIDGGAACQFQPPGRRRRDPRHQLGPAANEFDIGQLARTARPPKLSRARYCWR